MQITETIKKFILNSSIKSNLLSLYCAIVILMSFIIATMLFYSIDLNRTSNKILLNFGSYNKIYSQIDSIDKDIYLNITEQKKFNKEDYNKTIKEIDKELNEIGYNLDENKSLYSVEILKRTVETLHKCINDTGLLINNNSSYAARNKNLLLITHIKEIIKDHIQDLMELNLTQSQKRISTIKSSYNIALSFIIILFIMSIIASVSFLLLVIKDTVNKINIVSDNANKLANGDLSIEHISLGDSNEFHILATSFNKMKNNINDYVRQISSSEARVSSILNALNECIVSTNSQGKIESCNNATKKIFNYKKNEIIGQNINKLIKTIDFSRYKPDMFNAQKLIKDVKIIDGKYQLEGMQKDETLIPIEVSYNEVEIEGQRVMTFIIQDITQHKKVEKMKDEFISIVSHELRTPLTSIRGALGLVLSEVVGALPEKAKELLNIANTNSTRLVNLINDILDLEKIKAGKMDFNFLKLDIMPLVEESIRYNEEFASQYGVKYELTKSIDGAFINVDKDKFIQVLTNLLSNAAKFSYKNESIKIAIERINNTIVVSVTNRGQGIPEESYYKIFESFSQVDSSDSRTKGGTGLGLNIAKSIIKEMGGDIGFTSDVNDTTTFYFKLPEAVKYVAEEKSNTL